MPTPDLGARAAAESPPPPLRARDIENFHNSRANILQIHRLGKIMNQNSGRDALLPYIPWESNRILVKPGV